MRRQDSSGSDDSYTISHSETDQSDIEVRIHALAEQLRQRKYEAEKLKREQKRKYREHLRGKELSLQKQVETYNQIIQQVKADLEQFEAMSTQAPAPDSVRPQIKWPRPVQVLDSSRRLGKQAQAEAVAREKKLQTSGSSDPSLNKKEKLALVKQPQNRDSQKLESTEKLAASSSDTKPTSLESVETVDNISEASHNLLSSVSEALSAHENPSESREDAEIEEESYESSASSIVTVDSVSEKHKTSAEEKITPESGSSDMISTLVTEKDLAQVDQSTTSVHEEILSSDQKQAQKDVTEGTEQQLESDKSPSSGQSGAHESLPSSEIEYSYQFSSVTDNSAKELAESGSFESEEYSTPSSGNKSDNTSPTESISDVDEGTPKQEIEVVTKASGVSPKSDAGQLAIKGGLKSETFVVNVVNFLHTSLLDDAIRNVLNLSRKSGASSQVRVDVYKSGHDVKEGGRLEAVTSGILTSFVDNAISCILNIASNYHKPETCTEVETDGPERTTGLLGGHQPATPEGGSGDTGPAQSPAEEDDKTESTIFKKQIDWFDDGLVAAQWTNQQLEQQLLLQQYPYYYRKIPNKPPPPYTPPATSAGSPLQIHLPLPIKRDKQVEKPDAVKLITKNIDLVIDCIADALLDGKKEGPIEDVGPPSFESVIEELELKLPCQLTFLDLMFDLAKEIVLDFFNENPPPPTPWLRPRRLAPKPLLPASKEPLVSALRREMGRALRLDPPPAGEERRRRPTRAQMKLGRRKRDFVDTVLIAEIGAEEPDWTNYDADEVTVKCRVADAVLDLLLEDTAGLLRDIDRRYVER